MNKILPASVLPLVFLTGCNFLIPRQETPVEQQVVFLKGLTRTATYLAIVNLHKDDVVEREQVAETIKETVTKLAVPFFNKTNEDGSLIVDLQDALENYIPHEYLLLMQNAVDFLSLYYEIPAPGSDLDPDSRKLVIAFLSGVVEGCNLILREA